jgi:hypothetical protein
MPWLKEIKASRGGAKPQNAYLVSPSQSSYAMQFLNCAAAWLGNKILILILS